MKFILGKCHGMILAGEEGHGHETERLEVFYTAVGGFANVNTYSRKGIDHAKEVGLVTSELVEVIFSSYIHEIAELLSPEQHQGRIFTILRHPVDRAVSFYFHHIAANPDYGGYSLIDFFTSPETKALMKDNWMTRYLVNRKGGDLTIEDADLAQEILRRKVIVGLADDVPESLRRFKKAMKWKNDRRRGESNTVTCEQRFMVPNAQKRPQVEKGGQAWELITEMNRYDMKIYDYAVKLFAAQRHYF